MNIIFFGTSDFAVPSLKRLLGSKHEVVSLVTQPDRKKGRRQVVSPPPTKVAALSLGVPVFQPEDVSDQNSIEYLKKLGADLFVVVSFGQILKKEILAIPKLYCINLHGSLLPKYRGAAPTNWAIINGERATGVSVIKMNERMDAGDIISRKELEVKEKDTNLSLSERLKLTGAELLLETIESISKGIATFRRQDDKQATYAPKLKKKDGLINWEEPSLKVHNKVRGFIPWPGAYTYFEGRILKIWKTEVLEIAAERIKAGSFGEVIDIIKDKGIIVSTGSGAILIKELQLEGKKVLDCDSFIRGHMINRGYKFVK